MRRRSDRSRTLLGLLAGILLLAHAPAADVLVLKDGRRIEGKVVERTAADVAIETTVGTFRFPRSQIVEIIEQKTKQEVHAERLARCVTAEDFYQLGVWCDENKLRKESKAAWERAIELDPDHAGARGALGFVRYRDEWMTPEERERRMAADYAAEMRAKGFVQHEGRWVSPEDKAKLEQGLVQVDGRWMSPDAARRAQGLEEFDGRWLPREEALARRAVQEAERAVGRPLRSHLGAGALVCGTLSDATLAEIGVGLERGRAWFDAEWKAEPGTGLFGERLAEFYVFGDDSAPYLDTIGWIVSRSRYVPEGWAEAVQNVYGFVWTDPIAISSARQWNRPEGDVVGHCYHHLGHLMVNRLGYRGRLLPPWYDEGVAGLCELRVHGRNAVFCRSSFTPEGGGSKSDAAEVRMDSKLFRDGTWRTVLQRALSENRIRRFDQIARLEFSQLEMADVAASIAIVEWLEGLGPDALAEFHRELRKGAPPAPQRVIQDGRERQDVYDRAFRAAAGVGFREADETWRRWFLSL
jgi:hypothetical protein